MKSSHVLKPVNLVLVTAVVAVLLGCGGDLATPPPGSTEEKLNGEWEADPLPGEGEIKHTTRELDFAFLEGHGGWWKSAGFLVWYHEAEVPRSGGQPRRINDSYIRRLTVDGLTAAGAPADTDDASAWSFRLDPETPGILFATWTLKDGTKRLDEVKFHRKR